MRIMSTDKKHSTIMGDFNIDLKYNIHEKQMALCNMSCFGGVTENTTQPRVVL